MTAKPTRELVSVDGRNIVLERPRSPLADVSATDGKERFNHLNVLDARFRPENYDKADGTPLRLFDGAGVKIDVSKRSKEDMGFWHRNVDAHEIIICIKGALRWETEMGVKTMHEGDMMFIPKGIAHRSMLCEDSAPENVLVELKIVDECTYVGG